MDGHRLSVAPKPPPSQHRLQSVAIGAARTACFRLSRAQRAKRQGSCSKPVVTCSALVSPSSSPDAKAAGGWRSALPFTVLVVLAAAYLLHSVGIMTVHFVKTSGCKVFSVWTVSSPHLAVTALCFTVIAVTVHKQEIKRCWSISDTMAHEFDVVGSEVEAQFGDVTSTVGNLQSHVGNLSTQVGSMKSESGNLESLVKELESQVKDLRTQLARQKTINGSMQAQLLKLTNEVKELLSRQQQA